MRNYIFIILFYFLLGCNDDRNKENYISTTKVCPNLFVESYRIFGSGAYGGDRVTDYLTDSFNFRIYIGTYDNGNEAYTYECKNNTIYIYKVSGRRENKNKIVLNKNYNLLELKKKKSFE